MKRGKELLKKFIKAYGKTRIPKPEHYPLRFRFMTLSLEHYEKMKARKTEIVINDQ